MTKKTKEFFKSVIDFSTLAGLFVDVNRNIQYCNRQIEDVFGYAPEELIGKKTELLYGDRRNNPKEKGEIYEALERGGIHIGTARGITKSKKRKRLQLSTFVIRPNKGAIILVEELKKASVPEIDKGRLLQNLLDAIPDMIYFKDTKNRFTLVNKSHAACLGLTPEEVMGKSDLDFFPKEISVKYYANDTEILKTGKPIIGKIEKAARPDGGVTYVSTTKVPHYDAKGAIIGTIGVTRNITDKMVAQEELRMYKDRLEDLVKDRTHELEENNKRLLQMYTIKSEFASMVSHELRTPLTIIKEGVSLVGEEALGNINEKQKYNLDITLKNINRLARLINDILDFSKLEGGKVNFKLTKGDINETISQVLRTYEPEMKKKRLRFKTELGQSLPAVIFDRDRVTQVLYNLLSNAVKFTEKGHIAVKTGLKDDTILVSIKDTGCGIKKGDMHRVFNRFEQLTTDEGKRRGGTGLGLAISKQIVEQLGGKIFVRSTYGKGSTFFFTLPI